MIRNGIIRIRMVPRRIPAAEVFLNGDLHPIIFRWTIETHDPFRESRRLWQQRGRWSSHPRIVWFNDELIRIGRVDCLASSFPPKFVSVHEWSLSHYPDMSIGDTIDDVISGDEPCYRYDPSSDRYDEVPR